MIYAAMPRAAATYAFIAAALRYADADAAATRCHADTLIFTRAMPYAAADDDACHAAGYALRLRYGICCRHC